MASACWYVSGFLMGMFVFAAHARNKLFAALFLALSFSWAYLAWNIGFGA